MPVSLYRGAVSRMFVTGWFPCALCHLWLPGSTSTRLKQQDDRIPIGDVASANRVGLQKAVLGAGSTLPQRHPGQVRTAAGPGPTCPGPARIRGRRQTLCSALCQDREPIAPVEAGTSGTGPAVPLWVPGLQLRDALRPRWTARFRPPRPTPAGPPAGWASGRGPPQGGRVHAAAQQVQDADQPPELDAMHVQGRHPLPERTAGGRSRRMAGARRCPGRPCTARVSPAAIPRRPGGGQRCRCGARAQVSQQGQAGRCCGQGPLALGVGGR